MRKIVLIALGIVTCVATINAQKAERKQIREGNRSYKDEHFTESEIAYRKALDVDGHSKEAMYNLGNSLFKQEKSQEALAEYQKVVSVETDPKNLASAWHNLGNAYMQAQDLPNAIQSYKASLIQNPSDNETRYNLALAQALLKQQQQQEQQENQEKEEQEEKDDRQQQQQQEQNQQNSQDAQDQQQQEAGQEQISKERAQELLDALMQDEKEVQEKVKKLQIENYQQTKTDKDW